MSARPMLLIIAAALVAFAASLSLTDIESEDYFWQLRTGQLIWETGAVPTQDPFSYTAPGAPYVDIHWLFQLWLFAVHRLGGEAAVVVGKLAWVLLTLGLLAPIGARRERPAVSGAAGVLVLVLLAERIMPRAELPSFALLAGLLLLLDRLRRPGDRFAVLWIILLQGVWANTHGLFAVGIAVVAIHLAGDLFDRWSTGSTREAGSITRLAVAFAGSIAVSFANPNGWRGVVYPIQQLGMIGSPEDRALGSSIVELQPTLGGAGPMVIAAAALLFGLALLALIANRRAAPMRDWLLGVAFLYLALTARRNLALFAIVVAPIAVAHCNAWLDANPRRWTPRLQLASSGAVVLACALLCLDVATTGFHLRLGVPREPGFGLMRNWYSLGAADWIARHHPPGPIAHHMADGGLFIARLYPEYPVMVDGRLEVYGPELFDRLQWRDPADFVALHREHRFGTVVVHFSKYPSGPMLVWLQSRPAWKLVFVDPVSAVYVRDPDGRFEALDVDADDLFPPLVDEGRVQAELQVRGRALFYTALRREGRARAAVAWARDHYPEIDFSAP